MDGRNFLVLLASGREQHEASALHHPHRKGSAPGLGFQHRPLLRTQPNGRGYAHPQPTTADDTGNKDPSGNPIKILNAFHAVQQALNPPTGPRITSIVPPAAAAGFGQMINVSGNGFPDLTTWATDRPRVLFTQGSTSAQGFLFIGSPFPTPSMLFVRLPFIGDGFTTTDLVFGPASVAVVARNGSSNSFPLTVSTTPGKPSARFAMLLNAAPTPADPCGSSLQSSAAITQIKAGQGIGVSAFGIDTGGSSAIFTQGNTSIEVGPSLCGFNGSDFGVANTFAVPTSLVPGPEVDKHKKYAADLK